MSEISKAIWANSNIREKRLKNARGNISDKGRQILSEKAKKQWSSPEYKQYMIRQIKERWNEPGRRERQSQLTAEMSKKNWAKYSYREKQFNRYYRGSYNKLNYPVSFTKMRRLVIIRDENICVNCGCANGGLDVHHIDHDIKNSMPNNLVCLCRRCHSQETYGDKITREKINYKWKRIVDAKTIDMPLWWHETVNDIIDQEQIWLSIINKEKISHGVIG